MDRVRELEQEGEVAVQLPPEEDWRPTFSADPSHPVSNPRAWPVQLVSAADANFEGTCALAQPSNIVADGVVDEACVLLHRESCHRVSP